MRTRKQRHSRISTILNTCIYFYIVDNYLVKFSWRFFLLGTQVRAKIYLKCIICTAEFFTQYVKYFVFGTMWLVSLQRFVKICNNGYGFNCMIFLLFTAHSMSAHGGMCQWLRGVHQSESRHILFVKWFSIPREMTAHIWQPTDISFFYDGFTKSK